MRCVQLTEYGTLPGGVQVEVPRLAREFGAAEIARLAASVDASDVAGYVAELRRIDAAADVDPADLAAVRRLLALLEARA